MIPISLLQRGLSPSSHEEWILTHDALLIKMRYEIKVRFGAEFTEALINRNRRFTNLKVLHVENSIWRGSRTRSRCVCLAEVACTYAVEEHVLGAQILWDKTMW